MRKLGGLALLVVIALTACATPSDTTEQAGVSDLRVDRPTANAIPLDRVQLEDFTAKVRASTSTYANAPQETVDSMAKEICEHYADGFTTQDLRDADGERLAIIGDIALETVCR